MASDWTNPAACNCLALRQAARHVTQFYDQFLASSGLRTTQYSILARLNRKGPMTINALAGELVMDRTTLTAALKPLERRGLVKTAADKADRRSRLLTLTPGGITLLSKAVPVWERTHASLEARPGANGNSLRRNLGALV